MEVDILLETILMFDFQHSRVGRSRKGFRIWLLAWRRNIV